MGLSIEWRQVGKVVVVDVSGRPAATDGSIVHQTVRRLLAEGKRLFVFNLSGLLYLDSTGLGQFISTYMTVRDAGGDVKLVNPIDSVRHLLRYTRIDSVLEVFATEADAVQALENSLN